MAARWLQSFRGRLLFAAAALFLVFGALLAYVAASIAERSMAQTTEKSALRMLAAFEQGAAARIRDAGWLAQQEAGLRERRAQDMADLGAAVLDYFWDLADENPRGDLGAKNQALACMDRAGLYVVDGDGLLLTPYSDEKKRAVFGRDPSPKVAAMWAQARSEGKGVLTRPSAPGEDRPPESIAFAWQQAWDFLVAAPAPKPDNPKEDAPSADRTVKELAQTMAGALGPGGAFFWVFTGKADLPVLPRPFGETWPAPFTSLRDATFLNLKKAADAPDRPVAHLWPSMGEGAAMEVSSYIHKLPNQDVFLVASIPPSAPGNGVRYRIAALVFAFAAVFCLILWRMSSKLTHELSWLGDRVRGIAQAGGGRPPKAPKRPYREVAKISAAISALEETTPRQAEPKPRAPLAPVSFTPVAPAPAAEPAPPPSQASGPRPKHAPAASLAAGKPAAPSKKPLSQPKMEPVILESKAPKAPSTPPAPGSETAAFAPVPEGIEELSAMIARFSDERGVPPDDAHELRLAAEEVAVAIVENKGEGLENLHAELERKPGEIRLTIKDDGPAFDPTAGGDTPDAGPLPGLGQSLLVQLVDEARWERRDDRNVTLLVKKLAS
ncbi:MAG: ATP-binding protein [Thermodesulfobacteriota bacterium]